MSEIIQQYQFLKKHLPESFSRRFVVLTGTRQTWKTIFSESKYPGLNYINLDSHENRETVNYSELTRDAGIRVDSRKAYGIPQAFLSDVPASALSSSRSILRTIKQ